MKTIKFLFIVLMLTASAFLFTADEAPAQTLLSADTLYTLDTSKTIRTAGFEDFYLDLWNTNADSTNTVHVLGINAAGWETPIGMIDQTSSYNYTTVTSAALAVSIKKSYKLNAEGFQYIKIVLPEYNGAANKVLYELKAIRKTRF